MAFQWIRQAVPIYRIFALCRKYGLFCIKKSANKAFVWRMPDCFWSNGRKKKEIGGLFRLESRAFEWAEPLSGVKRAFVFRKRRLHFHRKTVTFSKNDYFFFKYLYMFFIITYIVPFKIRIFPVFLSGCLPVPELPFLPERYSRHSWVDNMIQEELFAAQYASYIDKCDQSDRRKNELEPFLPACLSLGTKEWKLSVSYYHFDILLVVGRILFLFHVCVTVWYGESQYYKGKWWLSGRNIWGSSIDSDDCPEELYK